MNQDVIKNKVRTVVAKHFSFGKDNVGFMQAEEDLTKLVVNEIESEIQKLQTKVHKITGDGEVMMLFNEILGVSAT